MSDINLNGGHCPSEKMAEAGGEEAPLEQESKYATETRGEKQTATDDTPVESVEPIDDETSTSKILELAAEDDDTETLAQIKVKAERSQFGSIGERILQKETKDGDLQKRSKQAVLHLTFTELRITQLEKELQTLRAKFEESPDKSKFKRNKEQWPISKHVIKRSRYDEFRLTTHSGHIPFEQRPALEVLLATGISAGHPDGERPFTLSRRPSELLGQTGGNTVNHQTPEMLRIRSLLLIGHLEVTCKAEIVSSRLWNFENDQRSALVLLRPFKLLVSFEKEIRDSKEEVEKSLKENPENDKPKKAVLRELEYDYNDLLQDLNLLVEFLDVDLKPTFDLRDKISKGTATEIEYGDLWHLFEMGDIVVGHSERGQAYRVVNFTGGRDRLVSQVPDQQGKPDQVDGFVVDCCSTVFDGTDYVPKLTKFTIRKFIGRRPITSLEVYPLKFHKDNDIIRNELSSWGHKYMQLTSSPFAHRIFRGKTLDEPPQELDAQVIIDIASAVNVVPDWREKRTVSDEDFTKPDMRETSAPQICGHSPMEGCCGSDYIFKDLNMRLFESNPIHKDYEGLLGPRRASELREEDFLLLPNWLYGFVLRSRQWVTLKMDDLFEVPFDNDFDELMVPGDSKQTILALVETHENARTTPDSDHQSIGTSLDIVKGKGAGLILLLHGEPGVGKTSTAECVADKTKRPLYPITCGDIGETAMEVEKNLHHNFRLAHKWGCVLLLDEADVFLAKRNKVDLRRNAVTSVFLRSLEYYAGILFLTTNRVGGIDPAFKSRIHLTLYYPKLDVEMTLNLYKVFLRRTRAEQERAGAVLFKIKDKEILGFAERHHRHLERDGFSTWNGRQIRNAFQTAIALVEYEAKQNRGAKPKPTLGKAQFKIVAEGSKEFDRYLMRTLQGADDEIAIKDQWRNDRFDGTNADHGAKATLKLPTMTSRRNTRRISDSESDDPTDDTESEDEDSDEDSDASAAESKAGASTSTRKSQASREVDEMELEELLKLKAMLKAKEKKKTGSKK